MKINFFLISLLSVLFVGCLTANTVSCPSGFKLINQNKCLKVFPNHFKHLEAEKSCTTFGGTLVTVKNAIDNRAVVNMAANSGAAYTWIGMFCFGNDTSTCYHDDNTGNPTYNAFQPGFPRVDSRFGGCVYMPTTGNTVGQWLTGPCEVTGFSFICEVPTTFADSTCTHNFNGFCYIPSHEMTESTSLNYTTYAEATVICEEHDGAKLASVHSKREVDFIRGIYKGVPFNKIFLGAKTFVGDAFDWEDDTRWDYDYMDPIAVTNGSCLQMDTFDRENNGMWSRVDCDKPNYFLCKRPIGGVQVEMKEKWMNINPKFKVLNDPAPTSFPDFSQCNTTYYLGPGTITSFGYPLNPVPVFCTWKLAALGPYRLGLYFTDFSVADDVKVYDEYGNLLTRVFGNMYPFQVLAPTNILTITHSSNQDGPAGDHGFRAMVLPF